MVAGAFHELPVNVTARPAWSTATQNDPDGHDTALSTAPPSIVAGALQELPLNVTARPAWSTATQNDAEAHDTESGPPPSASGAHARPLNVDASSPTNPTQNDADAHDTEEGPPTAIGPATAYGPATKTPELHELPLNVHALGATGPHNEALGWPNATQNDGDAHDTERSEAPVWIVVGALHELPLNVHASSPPNPTQNDADAHDTDPRYP